MPRKPFLALAATVAALSLPSSAGAARIVVEASLTPFSTAFAAVQFSCTVSDLNGALAFVSSCYVTGGGTTVSAPPKESRGTTVGTVGTGQLPFGSFTVCGFGYTYNQADPVRHEAGKCASSSGLVPAAAMSS